MVRILLLHIVPDLADTIGATVVPYLMLASEDAMRCSVISTIESTSEGRVMLINNTIKRALIEYLLTNEDTNRPYGGKTFVDNGANGDNDCREMLILRFRQDEDAVVIHDDMRNAIACEVLLRRLNNRNDSIADYLFDFEGVSDFVQRMCNHSTGVLSMNLRYHTPSARPHYF